MTGPAEQLIGSYLTEVAHRMIGPAKARQDVLAELGAGLADATDAYCSAGLAPDQAARAAITEFGYPEQVADGFQAELTAAQGRRTALTLLRTGPLVGLLWLGAALASHLGAHVVSPWQWASMPASARLVTHIAGFALVLTVGSTLVTVAATGRLTRWLPASPLARPRWLPACPAASAAIAASGTAAVDIALLVLLATQAVSTPGRLAALPVAVAGLASLIRLTLTTRAARNCVSSWRVGHRPGR